MHGGRLTLDHATRRPRVALALEGSVAEELVDQVAVDGGGDLLHVDPRVRIHVSFVRGRRWLRTAATLEDHLQRVGGLALEHRRPVLDHEHALRLDEEYGQRITRLSGTQFAAVELLEQYA